MKPPAVALSEPRRGLWRGGDGGSDLTNAYFKAIWNCHNESPLYNEYILIKMGKNNLKLETTQISINSRMDLSIFM
jgi:hypothetical protein